MPPFVLALVLFVTSSSQQSVAPQGGPDVTARTQAVFAAIAAGDFATVEKQFNDRMRAALPPGAIAAAWSSLLNQAGAFKRCATTIRIQATPDYQVAMTTCEFERARTDAQVSFDKDGRIGGLFFRPVAPPPAAYASPSYVTPAAFVEQEQTVGTGEWALPGTLSIPIGAGPFPAVVLVAGSGPNDRDETIGSNKPFKDLAGGLASRGIVVLRYDKRTRVHGSKLAAVADFTVKQEVVDDVVEAIKVLRATSKVDRARVFVLGHSLGAMLIPRIGALDPSLAGLIALAGPARSLEDAIVEQTRYIAMIDGTVSADEQHQIDEALKLAAQVKALTPEDAKADTKIFGAPASYWLDLRGYDPPSAARSLKPPLLVLWGERDYQVTRAEFEKWKAALSGRTDVSFRTYPALNHLFIAGTGASGPADYQSAGHVDEPVVRDLAAWILHPGSGL